MGTINQQMATWCLSRGYKVSMYTFDCQIIDQSWSKLDKDTLFEPLKLRKDGWVVYGLDEDCNYKIADPSQSKKPGLQTIESEVMLAAISTAQIECDNLIFQLKPHKKELLKEI